VKEAHARLAEAQAAMNWLIMRIERREKRSARWPAGMAKAMTGRAPVRPMKPRARAEPVRR